MLEAVIIENDRGDIVVHAMDDSSGQAYRSVITNGAPSLSLSPPYEPYLVWRPYEPGNRNYECCYPLGHELWRRPNSSIPSWEWVADVWVRNDPTIKMEDSIAAGDGQWVEKAEAEMTSAEYLWSIREETGWWSQTNQASNHDAASVMAVIGTVGGLPRRTTILWYNVDSNNLDLDGEIVIAATAAPFTLWIRESSTVAEQEIKIAGAADFDVDGQLTAFDFLAFQNAFAVEDMRSDYDRDGSLTIFDFIAFMNYFEGEPDEPSD